MAGVDAVKCLILPLLCLLLVHCSLAGNCKGCVQLDSYSFNKVISKFKAVLVKFDVPYPYGEKHDEYAKASVTVRDLPDLLLAEVGVKDYGEKDNADLAKQYKVDKEDFPVVKLFKPDADPVTFKGDFTVPNLLNFVRLNSEVYVGLPGCIEGFDKLALSFASTQSNDEKKSILLEAEQLWDKVKGASDTKSAEIYVKAMRKSLDNNDFITTEIKRVKSLIKGKVSKEKTKELKLRLNILKSFVTNSDSLIESSKDEL